MGDPSIQLRCFFICCFFFSGVQTMFVLTIDVCAKTVQKQFPGKMVDDTKTLVERYISIRLSCCSVWWSEVNCFPGQPWVAGLLGGFLFLSTLQHSPRDDRRATNKTQINIKVKITTFT